MNLIRWEPFKEAEDFFRGLSPGSLARWSRPSGTAGETRYEWAPLADISENDKEYMVKAELPGVKREDVKVTLEDGVLTIAGDRKLEREDKTEKSHRIERFYGSFSRSFGLPEHVDVKGIHAETKDGVLLVHVPKNKPETSKSVQIKGGEVVVVVAVDGGEYLPRVGEQGCVAQGNKFVEPEIVQAEAVAEECANDSEAGESESSTELGRHENGIISVDRNHEAAVT